MTIVAHGTATPPSRTLVVLALALALSLATAELSHFVRQPGQSGCLAVYPFAYTSLYRV